MGQGRGIHSARAEATNENPMKKILSSLSHSQHDCNTVSEGAATQQSTKFTAKPPSDAK